MSGPIVRTGPSPEFTKNWGNVFGKKGKKGGASAQAKKGGQAKGAARVKSAAQKKRPKKGGKK
jgi:hypothetical protein